MLTETSQQPKLQETGLPAPAVSVIVLNYNGQRWLKRCLGTLRSQTIFKRLEIIVADNASTDKSDLLAAELVRDWANARVVQHGRNLGFAEGNNRAAALASGHYLFFLNNDTWMEPDCLEQLLANAAVDGAAAAQPLIADYEDPKALCPTADGYDIFGMLSLGQEWGRQHEIFVAAGCSYLINRELFLRLGGFDPVFFMYAEEYDLSWRVWLAGGKVVFVPSSHLHHRGAADVNPEGGARIVELRTSDTKRYYTNRNGLLLLLKNCQHILLLLVPLQFLALAAEACFSLIAVRRWSFVRRAYVDAVAECWRFRHHVASERKRLRRLRRRTDWAMLRFFRWRLNRWDELRNMVRHGLPKVSAR